MTQPHVGTLIAYGHVDIEAFVPLERDGSEDQQLTLSVCTCSGTDLIVNVQLEWLRQCEPRARKWQPC